MEHKVYCPNCGSENILHEKNNCAFKACDVCKMILRFARWKTGKKQIIGYIKGK